MLGERERSAEGPNKLLREQERQQRRQSEDRVLERASGITPEATAGGELIAPTVTVAATSVAPTERLEASDFELAYS